MKSDAIRRCLDERDLDGALAQLSPSVVLHHPAADEPFEGKDAVAHLFEILFRRFEDLHCVGTYTSEDGGELLHLRWRLKDQEFEGVDMMRFDAHGLIDDYTVMVRPLSGVIEIRGSRRTSNESGSPAGRMVAARNKAANKPSSAPPSSRKK